MLAVHVHHKQKLHERSGFGARRKLHRQKDEKELALIFRGVKEHVKPSTIIRFPSTKYRRKRGITRTRDLEGKDEETETSEDLCAQIKPKMELEKLSGADRRKLEREIGMAPERVEDDIRTLRNWINCQPHLPNIEDDEENRKWLRNFLTFCKNRLEKAKHNLERYFSCRSLVPELFADRDPSSAELTVGVQALYLFPLPRLTPDGCRVHFFCHANADASNYDADAFMRRALMLLDWKIKEDVTHGDIFIFHMKHSSLAHLGKYNFATLSRFIAIVMNAYPLRIKAVHFTMAPSFVSYVISNPFITDKIKKRIKVHSGSNMKDLLSEIPEDCLPKELGGTIEQSLDELNDAHYKRLLSMREWFLKTENMKSDESKRPPELKTNELFGSDGSFRSLDVD